MITTRNELVSAKAMLDTLDQVNSALATIGKNTGTVSVALVPAITTPITVDAVDAVAFLTLIKTKLTSELQAMGVTL